MTYIPFDALDEDDDDEDDDDDDDDAAAPLDKPLSLCTPFPPDCTAAAAAAISLAAASRVNRV